MTRSTGMARSKCIGVQLTAPDDFDEWRDNARRLLSAGVPPEDVVWTTAEEAAADLFAGENGVLPSGPAGAYPARSSRAFGEVARKAVLHSDPLRFALLYRLIWNLQRNPRLMEDGADADVRRISDLARSVRRDIHKMRAFVRFRLVEDENGVEHYVAWFEPDHFILRANAAFFVNRFANMRWSILTPRGSLHWDGKLLQEGPPARRQDAPSDDPAEALWRTYYASIFNPARLKVGAMLKEMPRKYWKNMPEAALIPALVAGAQAREAAMVRQGETKFSDEQPISFQAIEEGIRACRRCEIGCNGTRAVMGEGAINADLMIMGEQPGDHEEQQGRPFIGPAGTLLRSNLKGAGLITDNCYVTNAVKHFKFRPKETGRGGKIRLHQTPTAGEIDMCRWWIESERALVKPRLVLGLGASAARSVLGRTANIQKERSQPIPLGDGSELWLTVHPAFLLRLDGAARDRETELFAADLRMVAERLASLSAGALT